MTERSVRRGVLNECGGSVTKHEEEEHELHVPRSCWAELALTHLDAEESLFRPA